MKLENILDFFLNSFQQFYGTDWIGMICQFIGMFLIARKEKVGFIIFAIGNGAWIFYAAMTNSMPQIIANLVVMVFNFYGYWNWKKK